MGKKQDKKTFNRINREIRSKEVRIIGDNVETGVYSLDVALKMAEDLELDLVEISPGAMPPVVKIIDYSKFKYNQKLQAKEQKKKQKESKQSLKEVRFGPNIDAHDFNFKAKHARNFLENGDLVKAYVFFKGREITFKEKGELLLVKLADELQDVGLPVNLDFKIEGKKMIMNLKPTKKKNQK